MRDKLYKAEFYDLGGTLNELNSPSETPSRDVIESNNWKVHKDGKSRIKRPGTEEIGDLGDPVRGIFKYEDENNFERIVVVTESKIRHREDVVTFDRKLLYPWNGQTYGFAYYHTLFRWGNKMVFHEPYLTADSSKRVIYTEDGENYSDLFTLTEGHYDYNGVALTEFADHLWMSLYNGGGSNPTVLEWDGTNKTNHVTATDYMACGFERFDGKLWALFKWFNGVRHSWRVRFYDGSSWTLISNYDGNSNIDLNTNQNISYHANQRQGRFLVYNNNLYLIVTIWSITLSKWCHQVWEFDQAHGDRFNKIYSSVWDSQGYGLSALIIHKGKVYLVGAKQHTQGAALVNEQRLFSSTDLVNWTVENSETDMGFPFGEVEYEGRIYLSTLYDTDNKTRIYYYDEATKTFKLEHTIDTNPITHSSGNVINFKGGLYVGKYKEIHKRRISSTTWTEIETFSKTIEEPVDGIVWQKRLITRTAESNIIIEGDKVFKLGIDPPTDKLTAADSGSAGNPNGTLKYVVTFYRSGNYPCESNPSPASDPVTVSSKKVSLTNIPISPDPKVNCRRIYRTVDGGAIFHWLEDIADNTTTVYLDNYGDADIVGNDEVSYKRYPPPFGKYYEVWDNRMWIAGVPGYENMLWFTNTGTAEEMASTNFIPLKRRESDIIMNIKAFGDDLYGLKRKSMFRVETVGESAYKQKQLPQKIGTDASFSVVVCDKLMMWKSEYGIEVFNGITCLRPLVSDFVRRTMAGINVNYMHLIMGGHNAVDGEYWLSIPTGSGSVTGNDKTIVFNYTKGFFHGVYSFAKELTYIKSIDLENDLMCLLGTPDGYVWINGSGYTDAGATINSNFKTAWINVSDEKERWNILRRMFIKYNLPAAKTITMKIYSNFDKDVIATISLPGSTPTTSDIEIRRDILRKINLYVSGYHVMFDFINNEGVAGGECRVIGWDWFFRRKRYKRTVKGD